MINPKLFSFFGWNPTGDFGPWTFYTAKSKKPVMFIKAPPTKPATHRQDFQRFTFKYIARLWNLLTQQERTNWETASKRARLRMTGYNLFLWYKSGGNTKVIHTIERQAAVKLLT